jgi:paraquat-inducible protein A
MTSERLIACRSCDLLHRRGCLPVKGVARCIRCGTPLYRFRCGTNLDRPLAMTLAAIVLLVMANLFPFINFNMEGRAQESVLISGLLVLYGQGWLGMALLVLLTGIVCPLIQLIGMAYVLIPLRWGWVPPRMGLIYRWVRHLQPWAMIEVYMLGILVTAAKLTDSGSVMPGVGLYAFTALMFVLPAATAGLNPESIWERIPLKYNI